MNWMIRIKLWRQTKSSEILELFAQMNQIELFPVIFARSAKKRSNTDVSCSYKNRSYFASSAAALGLTLGLGESKASEARRNKSVSCSQRYCLEKQIFLLQPFWRTILNLPKFLVIWSSLLQSFWRTILIQFGNLM